MLVEYGKARTREDRDAVVRAVSRPSARVRVCGAARRDPRDEPAVLQEAQAFTRAQRREQGTTIRPESCRIMYYTYCRIIPYNTACIMYVLTYFVLTMYLLTRYLLGTCRSCRPAILLIHSVESVLCRSI